MKKSVLFSMAAAFLVTASTVYAGALEIGNVNFLNSMNYPMYTTEETDVKVVASVKNNSADSQNGVLIFAVYNEEDMSLVSAKLHPVSDVAANKSVSVREQIALPDKKGYVLNVYLWDSEENGISLSQTYGIYDRQLVPAAPEGVTLTKRGYIDLEFSWLAPDHNLPIREYEIYCNGEKVGTSKTESFAIKELQNEKEYEVEIAAKDITGSISARSEKLIAKPEPGAYMILGETNKYELFDKDIPNSASPDGGFFNEVEIAGPENDLRECRKIQFIKPYGDNADGAANYLMFDVNNNYITPEDKEITIRVTCLDQGKDTIAVEYSSLAHEYTKMSVNKEDSGTWKTFTFKIDDALFNNRQQLGGASYDFRISTGESNTTEYIHRVEVFKGLVG